MMISLLTWATVAAPMTNACVVPGNWLRGKRQAQDTPDKPNGSSANAGLPFGTSLHVRQALLALRGSTRISLDGVL
ncbi:MAG: hypothetical protein M3412_11375, partial [Chloroflexota bacterium]|nr:hypothetical protein [Chloroflexota bacterium]